MLLYRNIEIVLAFGNKARSEIVKFIITTVTEIKNSVAKIVIVNANLKWAPQPLLQTALPTKV